MAKSSIHAQGYIPLGDSDGEDLTSSSKAAAAAGQMGSFNLLRLREIANQRDKTAKTFERGSDDDDFDSPRSAKGLTRIRSAKKLRKRSDGEMSYASESSVAISTKLRYN